MVAAREIPPSDPGGCDWIDIPRGMSTDEGPAPVWDGPSDPPPASDPAAELEEPIPFAARTRSRASEPETGASRVFPHDLAAEQAVLGSVLIDPTAMAEALDLLTPADFYGQAHGRIFAAMTSVYGQGQAPDVVMVANELARSGDLDDVGGAAFLSTLSTATPTSIHVGQYAHIVLEASQRRRLAAAAARVYEAATGGARADELDVRVDELHSLSNREAADTGPQLLRVADILPSPTLDVWLADGLLRRGALLVLASPEGLGKSQVRLEWAVRFATGTGALFGYYGIPSAGTVVLVEEENGPDEEFRREEAVLESLGLRRSDLGDRYFRVSYAGMSLTDPARQRWLRCLLEPIHPDLLILDTATAMVGDEWGAELKQAVRYLRGLIRDLGCSIVLTVHLTKPLRDRHGAKGAPHGSALSDVMGQWTRSSDVVAMMADLGAGRARWTVRKRVPPSQLILAQRGGLWETVAVAEDQAAATLEDRVLRAINAGAGSADELRVALGSADRPLPKASLYRALAALRGDGLVEDGTPLRLTESGMESVE
jgi:hypothetical protein